jgi:biotin carboxyl carrier protein
VCHLIIDAQDVLITLVTPADTEPTADSVTYWKLVEPPTGDDPLDALIPRLAAAHGDPSLLRFHFDDVGSAAGRAAGLTSKDPADALRDGSAMDDWRRMITAQGGDPDAPLPSARETHTITAPSSGVLTTLDAYGVGVAAWSLGAGRARKEDPVSFGAGVICHAKPGDPVQEGQPLLTLHTDDESRVPRALESLDGAYGIAESGPSLHPLIIDRVS